MGDQMGEELFGGSPHPSPAPHFSSSSAAKPSTDSSVGSATSSIKSILRFRKFRSPPHFGFLVRVE